jgi:hypothetical protein
MFRDVDMSGCYSGVMARMSPYVGRPVIHEPGSGGMTLKDAVAFVSEHAAGRDAWVIKVSGNITAFPNVLIPAARDALTNSNYKRRSARRRTASQGAKPGRYGFSFDRPTETRNDSGYSAIFTDVIEAGVVAHPTWLMIQAPPAEWRAEYEDLEVDSVLFYPSKLVADSGPEYDDLVRRLKNDDTPWTASIDMERLLQTVVRKIDDDNVALRFDIGKRARAMQERRERAKQASGKGKGAEMGW